MRFSATIDAPDDVDAWRQLARMACAADIEPHDIGWSVGEPLPTLFGAAGIEALPPVREPRVPRIFVETCNRALLHSSPQRFSLAYSLLYRLQSQPGLMSIASDRETIALIALAKSVRRDMHKMTAFVRFREITADDGKPVFIAWFEPDHFIVRATASFFANRFAGMRWSILTPKGSVHWDGATVSFGPAAERHQAPSTDALEQLWRGYYAAIFNPARLMPKAMQQQMPKKYWKNLPEASLINGLIAGARRRETAMIENEPNQKRKRLRVAPETTPDSVNTCRRCPLHATATQAVAGVGPPNAALMLVGEQPGDQEDLMGHPFVGPAGKVLEQAMLKAGLDRNRIYLTNAVKHFKFTPRGKRRIHQRPNAGEIAACSIWLEREIMAVRPRLIVALGATAAAALTGSGTRITERRGTIIGDAQGIPVLATIHPSYVLRLPDEQDQQAELAGLIGDLRQAAGRLREAATGSVPPFLNASAG